MMGIGRCSLGFLSLAMLVSTASVFADDESREAADAVAGLDVAPGLEATLFSSEPDLLSPTNIDIDARGRIWVCEVVNYRRFANAQNEPRKEGDRILILEDVDGDGKCDSTKVFYQGTDVDSAMGICVLGNKVIVSCSPNVLIFTDSDGDDVPDKKELLFTKTGQPQHDHSAHAFVFGPDGRLYWNFGNTGKAVHDADGNPIVDLAGNTVIDNGQPYYGGMVFRCDMDGSNFEVLAHNFRNNYEVAVDSFGTLWQSDNDDDGNMGVRINYVMEYGNYGYLDQMTGAGWRTPRTNLEESVPLQHWHLNDPGVVPNLLQTGAGSPTGICFYEGRLLPEIFHDQTIHCDAGPNVVRAYPAKKQGAGYTAEMVNILVGTRDKWFRPSDVCVAPDGSIFVADWYDPGVGGHRQGDVERGRIFRVAPPKTPYKTEPIDVTSASGAVAALQSPNHAIRYLAWNALHEMGDKAEKDLRKLYESDNPRHRARALWLLAMIKGRTDHYLQQGIKDRDSDIRITALRIARALKGDVVLYVRQLLRDPAPEVRRECALALRNSKSADTPALWTELALSYKGKDRWLLEGLGIAADGRWPEFLEVWQKKVGRHFEKESVRDIVWRSRSPQTPELIAEIMAKPEWTKQDLPRYLRAFDFLSGSEKETVLTKLAFEPATGEVERQTFVASEALSRLPGFDIDTKPDFKPALENILDQLIGTPQFIALVDKFQVRSRYPELLGLAQARPDETLGVEAIRALLNREQTELIEQALHNENEKEIERTIYTARVLGNAADNRSQQFLLPLVGDEKFSAELRREAVRSLGRTRPGAEMILELVRKDEWDDRLSGAAAAALHAATWPEVKAEGIKLFPLPPTRNNEALPPVEELLKRNGNTENGKIAFNTVATCSKCHVVNNIGKDVGPNLTEIGSKLSKQAMWESILFPSAGISHNYETYSAVLNDGNIINGILLSQTAEEISIKTIENITHTIKQADIDEIIKQKISLMPADVQKLLTVDELVDVVEYMMTLKKKTTAAAK
ncbi:MAG: PVC-type heme-binding CxxCH protein [Planctomycetaceae bacterium]